MRQLASIQKITNLEPIEGRDKIELASILGWKVIVEKKQFKIGDLCIYIEYDSILPEIKKYEFLRSRCYSKKWQGFRIRCMKMGNVFSQGIAFPIADLLGCDYGKWPEGKDVTEILKIRKYDPEALAEKQSTQKKSKNPIVNYLKRFKVTEKYDDKLIGSEIEPIQIGYHADYDCWDNGPTTYCRTDNTEWWFIVQKSKPIIIEKHYQSGDWAEESNTYWEAYECNAIPSGKGIDRIICVEKV